MFATYVKPSSELRNRYSEIYGLVKTNNQVIITNNGKADMVLIKMDDYKKYEEFLHLRYIDERLAEAENAASGSDAIWYTHDEIFGKLREKYGYDIQD